MTVNCGVHSDTAATSMNDDVHAPTFRPVLRGRFAVNRKLLLFHVFINFRTTTQWPPRAHTHNENENMFDAYVHTRTVRVWCVYPYVRHEEQKEG